MLFGLGRRQRPIVVRLFSPGQYVGVVDLRREDAVLLDASAPRGAEDGGKVRRMNPQLVVAVTVEVQPLMLKAFFPPQLPLGDAELLPDGVPKVRQVQATEDSMPVGVIALRPP